MRGDRRGPCADHSPRDPAAPDPVQPGPAASVQFRVATAEDADAIAAFGERCFRTSHGEFLPAAAVDAHARATFGVDHQRREIADPARSSIVGVVDGEIVAFAQLHSGPVPACVTGPDPIEVLRFYVDGRFHGTGLAQSLMTRALAAARDRGARTAHLLVLHRNRRAARFYARQGFVLIEQVLWEISTPPEVDDVMARPID